MSGVIVLYNREGEQVFYSKYSGKKERQEKLDSWKNRVGSKRFQDMYYHVLPEVRPELVSKEGLNARRVADKDKILKVPIKRPPANYDNKNYLDDK